MSVAEIFASHSSLVMVGEALIHFVWQGALVALLLASVLPLLRWRSANSRYLAACGALLLMLAMPVLTFWRSAHSVAAGVPPALGRAAAVAVDTTGKVVVPIPALTSAALTARTLNDRILPWLVIGWLAGVLSLSLHLCGGWLFVRHLERAGTRSVAARWTAMVSRMAREAGIRRPVKLVGSSLAQVPMVIGWLRPVILLPAMALTGLTPQQLEAVLAHELAHIRRHDYWMNLVQALAETLLFYHPAVWWVSKKIRIERENCCDDMSVVACGDALTFARALVVIEELRATPRAARLSLAMDGSPLLQRVRRLLESPRQDHLGPTSSVVGPLTAITMVAIVLASGLSWASAPEAPGSPLQVQGPAPAPPHVPVKAQDRPDSAPARDRVAGMSDAEIATLTRRGLDRRLLEQLRQTGDREVSLDEIRQWQPYGVNPKLLDELRSLGHTSMTVDQFLNLVWFGVDERFIQGLRGQGYGRPSVDDLITLARYGADATFISNLRNLGYRDLSVEDLAMLGRYEVDAKYIQSLQEAGYRGTSVEDLTTLKRYEVDASYIQDLKAAGYGDLSVDDLTALRRYKVDGDLVRKLSRPGKAKPSVAELLEAARYGKRD